MNIKIVVEDKKKGKIEIPISKKEIGAMSDIGFFFDPRFIKDLEDNKIKNDFYSICVKFQHLENDIINDGRAYEFDTKTKKAKLCNKKFWLVKKPRWTLV